LRIYAETNFLLEYVFDQEQSRSCKNILSMVELGVAELVIPAFSVGEAFGPLNRAHAGREATAKPLRGTLAELSRSALYEAFLEEAQRTLAFLVTTVDAEVRRYTSLRETLLKSARFAVLDGEVLRRADVLAPRFGLEVPDAIVLASILSDLDIHPTAESWLIERDRDFGDPGILAELESRQCKVFFRFSSAEDLLENRLKQGT
jgi:predicted nucleic acid-binding protein